MRVPAASEATIREVHRRESFFDGIPRLPRALAFVATGVVFANVVRGDAGLYLLWLSALMAGLLSTSSA